MKITMTSFAKQQIRETARYIYKQYGQRSKDNFLDSLSDTKRLLETNPYIGPIEPSLSDLPSHYRSIVVGRLNKMIYRILDVRIEVSDFWDVRRDPALLANQLK